MNLNEKLGDLAALFVLFLVMLAFFGRLLTGDQLIQSDIIQFKGMSSEIREIQQQENTNETIHWTNAMFSGMPTYLISDAVFLKNNIAQSINHLVRYFLPGPAGILFIAFVCFYILSRSLSISKWLSAIGAFSFGAGSFVIISLIAGHNSKINAYAYAPLILAGIVLLFRRKTWAGVFCLAFGLAAQLAANHYQITFYTFLICLCLFISEAVHFYKNNTVKELLKPVAYSVLAIILAIGVNFNKLATTFNHAEYTTRGAKSELASVDENNQEKGGLSYDYATQWSYEPLESFTLLIPNFMGGASTEELGEKSNWSDQAQIPQSLREAPPTYWGEMPFTSGPVYLGAVLFALFVVSLFLLNGRWKWWAIASSLLMLFLAWGEHSFVYELFFNSFPFFNKFRTPMMALLMLSLIIPLVGIQGISDYLEKNIQNKQPIIYGIGIIAAVTIVFGFLATGFYNFSGAVDNQLQQGGFPNQLIDLLKQDRAEMLRGDALRSLVFILLTGLALYLYKIDKIRLQMAFIALSLLAFTDLFFVNKRYLSKDNFESKEAHEQRFQPSEIDLAIQKDTTEFYRVLNMTTGNPFSDAGTSNQHYSIGGYHAAKLQRYQDLIDYQLSDVNREVLHMLNTKYVIGPTKDGQIGYRINEDALGNAWFVQDIVFGDNDREIMDSLSTINVSEQAILPAEVKNELKISESLNPSNSSIALNDYHPEKMTYDVRVENGNQFAVFSEIYYLQEDDDGWHAYLNGREIPIYRTNYLLRGVQLPEGNHELVFQYEHDSFSKRAMVSKVFSALLLLAGIGFLRERYLQEKRKNETK